MISMDEIKVSKVSQQEEEWKSRGFILKCSDKTFLSLLQFLQGYPDCIIVYSKTSEKKLMLKEEPW